MKLKTSRLGLKNLTGIKPFKGLWILLSGYRLAFTVAIISLGFAAFAETAGFILLRNYIDKVIVKKVWTVPVYYIALGFVAIAVFRGIFSFLSGRASAHTSESVTRDIRNTLFDHIQRQSFAYHDRTPTGELIQRATSDVDAVRRFYSDQVLGISRILFFFIINFTAIIFMQWKLALFSIIAIPFIILISRYFFRMISISYNSYQEQGDRVSAVLQENLSGVRIVKAFARQSFEQDKFDKDNFEMLERGKRLVKNQSFYWPASYLVCGCQVLAGIIIGGIMTIRGSISIGTYLAYTGMINLIVWPMQQMGRLIVQLSTSFVSYNRIIEIMNREQEDLFNGIEKQNQRIKGEIIFNHVYFEYKKGIPVLQDVSFSCKPGRKIALLGEPGSGKTTLVNLLPRFYDSTGGEILLDGKPIKKYSRHFLRRNIGIVEQQPFLFSTTIKENITYGFGYREGKKLNQKKIEQAARAAAIHEDICSFPEGYDSLVGEKGVTLSGGQKQRIILARTILKDPAILIMDDSMSSVDIETEQQIRAALEKFVKGRTTFIIAHRIQSLMNADLILILKNGRIIQRGIHEELIAEPGFYQHIFKIQARIEKELEKEVRHA